MKDKKLTNTQRIYKLEEDFLAMNESLRILAEAIVLMEKKVDLALGEEKTNIIKPSVSDIKNVTK